MEEGHTMAKIYRTKGQTMINKTIQQKTKDWVTQTSLKTGIQLGYFRRV
jgi:hypothetical protein